MDIQLFTTLLYIGSSLVQADAAIFSLGAIFVIYRLQSLDSAFQNAFALGTSAPHSSRANHILVLSHEDFDPARAAIVYSYQGSIDQNQMRTVAYTALWKRQLIAQSMPAFLALVVHISLSAVFLLAIPNLNSANPNLFRTLAIGDVLAFVILVFVVTRAVIAMLSFTSPDIPIYYPGIQRPVPKSFANVVDLNLGRDTPALFEFQISGTRLFLKLEPRLNERYTVNLMTLNPKNGAFLVQKTFDDKPLPELENTWKSFVSDPFTFLASQ